MEDLKSKDILSLKYVKLKLSELKEKPDYLIKGGWFKNTKVPKVSSATIFGSTVSESDMWEELDQLGTLTRVVFEIPATGKNFSMAINEESSFIFYDAWNENESLTRVDSIVEDTIKQFFEKD